MKTTRTFAMKHKRPRLTSLAPLGLGLWIYLFSPAQALAAALLRFVHAVPGVGTAAVHVSVGSENVDFGSIGFAQSTAWHGLRSGRFTWRLQGSGGQTLATGTATVGNGAYTAVVLARDGGVLVGLYRGHGGVPGKSLIRVIHAAPELGSPELEFDSRVVVNRLSYTQATPYLSVNQGVHSLAAMRPGSKSPLVSVTGVHLVNGVAYSVIVLGSRGQRVRVLTVTDRGAPRTRQSGVARTTRSQPVTSSAAGSQWVTIKPGDSLWKVAREHLGPDASNAAVWREVIAIWDSNVARIGTGDPNLIFPGQRIHLPAR